MVPGGVAEDGRQPRSRIEFTRRRRLAQPQRRLPLRAVRAGARAPGDSRVRSAGPEGALDARRSSIPAKWQVGRQRRRDAQADRRRCDAPATRAARSRRFAETQPLSDLSLLVRRRRLQGRDRRAQRPHVPDVPPRDRRREGGAQPRRDLRPARARARVHGAATPASRTPFGKFDFVAIPAVPVRRHGARRQDPLQRVGAAARRVGDAEPVARPRVGDRARNRAHVVRRPGDDALVQRRVDEGGVRQLHGGEDRQPVVPRGEPRPALPAVALSRRPTRSIARPAPTRSASRSTT